MNVKIPKSKLTDADLDHALHADQDAILPSSGFADSVMAAVRQDAAAPAPIPFPWRRALPGISVAVLVLIGFISGLLSLLRSAFAASAAQRIPASSWLAQLAPRLQITASGLPSTFWLVSSLALVLACLLLCRRLIFAR